MSRSLLPEEDALDDPDDDEADPTLPGDLWFRRRMPRRADEPGPREGSRERRIL